MQGHYNVRMLKGCVVAAVAAGAGRHEEAERSFDRMIAGEAPGRQLRLVGCCL